MYGSSLSYENRTSEHGTARSISAHNVAGYITETILRLVKHDGKPLIKWLNKATAANWGKA